MRADFFPSILCYQRGVLDYLSLHYPLINLRETSLYNCVSFPSLFLTFFFFHTFTHTHTHTIHFVQDFPNQPVIYHV